MRAKLRSQKGNSPDLYLRSLNLKRLKSFFERVKSELSVKGSRIPLIVRRLA